MGVKTDGPVFAAQTEASMKDLLTRALLPEGRPAAGVLATGIGSPDGVRVADAIWAPYGHGRGLEGYEIKVSRADVMVELRDPMKAEHWSRFCQRWWLFVADPAFVDGLDVPPQWGVVAPPSGRRTRGLTLVRPAPVLKPVDTGEAWKRVHAWYAHRHADRTKAHEAEVANLQRTIDTQRATIADLRALDDPLAASANAVLTRLTGRLHELGIHAYGDEVADAAIEAMVDVVAARRYARARVRSVTAFLDDLDRQLTRLRASMDTDGLRARISAIAKEIESGPSGTQ